MRHLIRTAGILETTIIEQVLIQREKRRVKKSARLKKPYASTQPLLRGESCFTLFSPRCCSRPARLRWTPFFGQKKSVS